MGIHDHTVQEATNIMVGQSGFDYIADTNQADGSWVCVKAVADDAIGDFDMAIGDSLSSFTITKNDFLFGPITSITLSAGAVLAYRG